MSYLTPTDEEQQRLMKIRVRGKRGERLWPEEVAFLEMVYFGKYQEWWEENEDRLNAELHEATKPFGAI